MLDQQACPANRGSCSQNCRGMAKISEGLAGETALFMAFLHCTFRPGVRSLVHSTSQMWQTKLQRIITYFALSVRAAFPEGLDFWELPPRAVPADLDSEYSFYLFD